MSFSMYSIFRFLYTILFEIKDFLFYEVHVRCKPFSGPARARKRPRAGLRRRGARKRHSCSSHAVSQRHRASQDVLPRLDLPRAPPRLDTACLPGTGDTALPPASMPRVQAYDQAFSSSPPPAQPRLFNHTNTIPTPSPINGDAIATILKGLRLL